MASEVETGVSLEDLFGEEVAAEQHLTSNELLADLFGEEAAADGRLTAHATHATTADGASQLHLPHRINKGTAGRVSSVRFPKALSASTRLFDPLSWEEEREGEEMRGEGKAAAQAATIRWRLKYNADGDPISDPATGRPVIESNSRVVEWEDGSLTLHVGNEVYSLHTVKGNADAASYVFNRVTSQLPNAHAATHKETVLEAAEGVKTTLVVRALQTSTAARFLYESRVAKEADIPNTEAAAKGAKVERKNLFFNPEEQRKQRIKEEDEAARRLEAQRRKGEEALRAANMAAISSGGRSTGGRGGRRKEADYEAAGEGDDTINLGSLKRAAKRAPSGPAGKRRRPNEDDEDVSDREASDDDEDEEDEGDASEGSDESSAGSDSGSSDGSDDDDDDDDDSSSGSDESD